jgi:hypothetical protein
MCVGLTREANKIKSVLRAARREIKSSIESGVLQ